MRAYSLIPGMESFMEDTDVSVEVEVGNSEEVVEEQEEAVETAAEGAEEVAEAESNDEQAEMIFQQFDRVEGYLNHVKRYGVDRTFLSLLNRDGSLSQAIGYHLPSCESFDVTGSPYSAESQAVIAGLESVWESIKDFVVSAAKKIKDFFVRIWNWIMVRLGDVDKNIGRLRKRIKDTKEKDNFSDISGDVKIPNIEKVEESALITNLKVDESTKTYIMHLKAEIDSIMDEIRKAALPEKATSMGQVRAGAGGKDFNLQDHAYNTDNVDFKKDSVASKAKKDLKEKIKSAKSNTKTVSLSQAAGPTIESWLSNAATLRREIIMHQAIKDLAVRAAELIERSVAKFNAHEDENSNKISLKEFRNCCSHLSSVQSVFALMTDYKNWIISTYIKAAAKAISATRTSK